MKISNDVKKTVSQPKDVVTESVRTYTIDLPSKGQLYGGKSKIEMSFLSTVDVKRLYDINQGTKTDSIEKLVGSKILDFNVEDLTLSDFWYVLYYMRINSFDKNPLELEWTCESFNSTSQSICGKVQTSPIVGSALIIKELDSEYREPVTVTFPHSGELNLKLPRISDTLKVSKLKDTKFKNCSDSDEWVLNKASLIDNGVSLFENYMLVSKMKPEDLFLLDAFQSEYTYGVQNAVNFSCANCGEVSLIPFQIRVAHFFPSMQSSRFIRDAIRFSSKP